MQKLNRIVQIYLVWASPLIVGMMIWGTLQPESEVVKLHLPVIQFLWTVLAWNLMFWFVVLIGFLVSLVLFPKNREETLVKLANMKERDEREEYVTGRAAKSAYISMLSLIILLLFLSMFSVQIYRLPPEQAISGKTGTLSIGMNFNLLNETKAEDPATNKMIFESKELPLSKTGILLLLFAWQIAAFQLRARKEI